MSDRSSHAVVLHSGGIDSTLMLKMALDECDKVTSLFFAYGAKAGLKEFRSWYATCNWFQQRTVYEQLQLHKLDLSSIFNYSRSQLSKNVEGLDEWSAEQVASYSGGEVSTSVEFRNGVFISIATSVALQIGASEVWIGSTGQGALQYADCKPAFISSMGEAVQAGTDHGVQLFAPLSRLDKSDIIRQVVQLAKSGGYPLAMTRTCYSDQETACGVCLSCVERKEAFDKIGYRDPATTANNPA